MSKNLAFILKEAALRGEQFYLKICTVDSVDTNERSINCTPIDGTAQLINVQLEASLNAKKGLCIFPKKGSKVVVGFLDKNNSIVILTDETAKITLDFDNEFVINGGKHGLAKVPEVVDRLNKIEQKVNDILTALMTTVIPVAPSGSYALSANFSTVTQLSQTQDSDIENTNIKHS